ncbi:MAG: molybdopterin dinucleotide binding domain-containing protein [Candidatus Thorarchaeota archaeon]
MSAKEVRVLVTSGRTVMQGRAIEMGKQDPRYVESVAVCELDANTFQTLGIRNDETVLVKSRAGRVVLRARLNSELPQGLAFIPCGPYFNLLVDADTHETGMPYFKHLEATVTASPGASVCDLRSLLTQTEEVSE